MGQMATSGFLIKFISRMKKTRTNIQGDLDAEAIEATCLKRDGPPIVVGAVQKTHLVKGQGLRTNGIVGAKDGKDKLTIEYFGMGYGRSSPSRLLLDLKGIDYEYTGYDFPTWGQVKGSGQGGEFGGLPRLCVNGEEFG